MISYRPLWETLNKKNVSTYDLIYKQGISANTVHRMKHGKPVTTKTIDELCIILNCNVSDIIEFKNEET
ncbi:MAG: helix-turn-helix domain-containing protein [Clostridia bacterium]|nr:helix-turn-helix domain-containing protein [Clostridia bacterium]MBR3460788.1 helix-turn-helix domain-containing protein [Clostridia bacterium]